MKTAIRTTVNHSSAGAYNHMHIEILVPRYGGTNYYECGGTITFQQNAGEEKWYAMNFEILTDNISHLKKFTKLAEFIKKNSTYSSQPDEIKKLIGADEHIFYKSDFLSLSKNGQNFYKVIAQGGHYSNIVAPNENDANRQLVKLNINGASIEFNEKIVL